MPTETTPTDAFTRPMSGDILSLTAQTVAIRREHGSPRRGFELSAPEPLTARFESHPDEKVIDELTINVPAKDNGLRILTVTLEDDTFTDNMLNTTEEDEYGQRVKSVVIMKIRDSRQKTLEDGTIIEKTLDHNQMGLVKQGSTAFRPYTTETVTVLKPIKKPILQHGEELTIDYMVDGENVNLAPNAIEYDFRDGTWHKDYVYVGGDDNAVNTPDYFSYKDPRGDYEVKNISVEGSELIMLTSLMQKSKMGDMDPSLVDLVGKDVQYDALEE